MFKDQNMQETQKQKNLQSAEKTPVFFVFAERG